MAANEMYVVDPTAGVTLIPPAGMAAGQWLLIKLKVGTVPSGLNQLTIQTLSGGAIELPPGSGGPGVFGAVNASLVFNAANQAGESLLLVCDGNSNLELD